MESLVRRPSNCLGKSAPNFWTRFWFISLVGVVQPTVNKYNVLDENVDCHRMLVILLIDRKGLLVQAMISDDLPGIVILQLVDVANNLTLLGANGCQKEQVLQVLVVAERRWLNNYLPQRLDQLNGKIS
jgi:hypothetical protein